MNKLFGYYEKEDQLEPTYDPGLDKPCLICYKPLKDKPIKTISFMRDFPRSRSFFYRCHKSCYEKSSATEICQIESTLMDI